jgi:hypothetical protein
MLRHMRTTVRLKDELLERARREAARRGITLTAMIEQSLLSFMRKPSQKTPRRQRVALPICSASGGAQRGVNISDSAATLDRMEGRS